MGLPYVIVTNIFVCVTVLESGLNTNFSDVKVSVTDCPDLTHEPFRFPVKGEYRCKSVYAKE